MWESTYFRLSAILTLCAISVLDASAGAPAPQDTEIQAEFRLDASGESMEHVQVRNQNGIGICVASTLGAAYDAFRFSLTGDTHYEHQTSGPWLSLKTYWAIYKDKPEHLKTLFDKNDRYVGEDPEAARPSRVFETLVKFGSCSEDTLDRFLQTKARDVAISNVLQEVESTCSTRQPTRDTPVLRSKPFASFNEVRSILASHFRAPGNQNQKLQPLIIGYCANFSASGRAVKSVVDHRTWKGVPQVQINSKVGCYRHLSLVIGVRKQSPDVERQYLIQNSYGTDGCSTLHADFAKDCADGKFWIPESTLVGNLIEAWVLEK